MNQNQEADAAVEEKRTGQDEAKTEMDLLTMMAGVSLVPGNAQPPVTQPGLPDDFSSQLQPAASSIQTSEQTNVPARTVGKTLRAVLFPQEEYLLDASASIESENRPLEHLTAQRNLQTAPVELVLEQETNGNPLNPNWGPEPSQPSTSKRIVDPVELVLDQKTGGNHLYPNMGSEPSQPSASKRIVDPVELVLEQATSGNALNPNWGAERSQPSASKRILDPSTPIAAAEHSKTSQDAALVAQAASEYGRNLSQRADASAAAEKVELPDSFRISADSDKSANAVPAAVQASSGNLVTRATLENAGTDNSHANTENPQNEGVSWTAPPSQLANAPKDSPKASSSIGERQQDVTSQVDATPTRMADTGVPVTAGGAEATASNREACLPA
jgi:hypothetical protein